jgi:hypothetical protein
MKTHLLYLREVKLSQTGKDMGRHPVACVAILNNGAESTYQLSSTNPRDHFNKGIAKEIALGRLKKRGIRIVLDESHNFYQTAKTVLEALASDPHNPPRARVAALEYLSSRPPASVGAVPEAAL